MKFLVLNGLISLFLLSAHAEEPAAEGHRGPALAKEEEQMQLFRSALYRHWVQLREIHQRKQLEQKLHDTVIESLELRATRLPEALEAAGFQVIRIGELRQATRKGQIPLFVNLPEEPAFGMDLPFENYPVTASLIKVRQFDVLRIITELAGMSFHIHPGIVELRPQMVINYGGSIRSFTPLPPSFPPAGITMEDYLESISGSRFKEISHGAGTPQYRVLENGGVRTLDIRGTPPLFDKIEEAWLLAVEEHVLGIQPNETGAAEKPGD